MAGEDEGVQPKVQEDSVRRALNIQGEVPPSEGPLSKMSCFMFNKINHSIFIVNFANKI